MAIRGPVTKETSRPPRAARAERVMPLPPPPVRPRPPASLPQRLPLVLLLASDYLLSFAQISNSQPNRSAPTPICGSSPYRSIWAILLIPQFAELATLRAAEDKSYRGKVLPGNTMKGNGVTYQVDRIVGHGSFGVVFQATTIGTGEVVAIKKVLQDKRFKVCALSPGA